MPFEVGVFTKPVSTTGNQSISHSLGETPKAIILFTGGATADNTAQNGNAIVGIGFTDLTDEFSMSYQGEHGADPMKEKSYIEAALLSLIDPDATVEDECTFVSADSDDFTINWTTCSANAYRIQYMLIAGDGVQAKAIEWAINTSLPDQSITGVGFQPTGIIHLFMQDATSTPQQLDVGQYSFNLATDAFEFGISGRASDNVATSLTSRSLVTTEILVQNHSFNSYGGYANHVSMDSNGFTISPNGPPSDNFKIYSLCLTGLQVEGGSWTKSTGTAPATQEISTVSFQPEALILLTHTVNTTHNTNLGLQLGLTDGTNQAVMTVVNTTGSPAANCARSSRNDAVLSQISTTPAETARGTLDSLDNDGFTLTWDPNTTAAHLELYIALAEIHDVYGAVTSDATVSTSLSPTIIHGGQLTTDATLSANMAVSVQGSITSNATLSASIILVVRIGETITVSDAVLLPQKYASIFETITLTDTAGHVVPIFELISVLDRATMMNHIMLEEIISVSDAVALTVILSLLEDITVSDAITKIMALSEPITIADILALIKDMPVGGEAISVTDSVKVIKLGESDAGLIDDADVYIEVPGRKLFIIVPD